MRVDGFWHSGGGRLLLQRQSWQGITNGIRQLGAALAGGMGDFTKAATIRFDGNRDMTTTRVLAAPPQFNASLGAGFSSLHHDPVGSLCLIAETFLFLLLGCLSIYQVVVLSQSDDSNVSDESPPHRGGTSASTHGTHRQRGQQAMMGQAPRFTLSLTGGKTRTLFMSLLAMANLARAASLVVLLYVADPTVFAPSSSSSLVNSAITHTGFMELRGGTRHETTDETTTTATSGLSRQAFEQLGLATWEITVLKSLPSLLFLAAYTVVIIFWAQVYYAARLISMPMLRPLFILTVFLGLIMYTIGASITRVFSAWVEFRGSAYGVLGILHIAVAICFVYFGVQVAAHLAHHSKASQARDSIIRRVVLLSIVCPVIVASKGVLWLLLAYEAFFKLHMTTMDDFVWMALVRLGHTPLQGRVLQDFFFSELTPDVLMLIAFWSTAPSSLQAHQRMQPSPHHLPLDTPFLRDERDDAFMELRDSYQDQQSDQFYSSFQGFGDSQSIPSSDYALIPVHGSGIDFRGERNGSGSHTSFEYDELMMPTTTRYNDGNGHVSATRHHQHHCHHHPHLSAHSLPLRHGYTPSNLPLWSARILNSPRTSAIGSVHTQRYYPWQCHSGVDDAPPLFLNADKPPADDDSSWRRRHHHHSLSLRPPHPHSNQRLVSPQPGVAEPLWSSYYSPAPQQTRRSSRRFPQHQSPHLSVDTPSSSWSDHRFSSTLAGERHSSSFHYDKKPHHHSSFQRTGHHFPHENVTHHDAAAVMDANDNDAAPFLSQAFLSESSDQQCEPPRQLIENSAAERTMKKTTSRRDHQRRGGSDNTGALSSDASQIATTLHGRQQDVASSRRHGGGRLCPS